MASTFPMKMFLGAPFELHLPTLSLSKLLALPKLFILLSILVLGVVFWSGFAWTVTHVGFLISDDPASYVEGIDPVLPYYYLASWEEKL